ncbi:MAG: hypothetical protein MI923_30830, partial [Phycisphaerales bacterium]|nr:hypothetical protein [Phycisphaerales bacterium]
MPVYLLIDAKGPVTIRASAQDEVGLTLGGSVGLEFGIPIATIGANLVAAYTESLVIESDYSMDWMLGELGPGDPSDPTDDHGDSRHSATNFTDIINACTANVFESSGDEDWFRVSARQNETYYYFTIIGELPTTPVMELYDINGNILQQSISVADYMRLEWTPSATSDYFIRILPTSPADTGAYGFLFGDVDIFPCSAIGACCLPDGMCDLMSETDCESMNGAFRGDANCPPSQPCVAVGACCLPDGMCDLMSETDCESMNGAFRGDANCPPSQPCVANGACCLPDGMCDLMSETDCESMNGAFRGDANCPPSQPCVAVGAC